MQNVCMKNKGIGKGGESSILVSANITKVL